MDRDKPLADSSRSQVNQPPHKVTLTRRKWDLYMLPLLAGVAVIGSLRVWQTGQLQFALAPLAVIPLWLMLRLQTPRDGLRVTTIRSTPGAVVLLWFMAASVVTMGLLVVLDIVYLGHPLHAPLEPYHALLFAPPFVIMFAGVFRADRIARREKAAGCGDDDEEPGRTKG